MNKEDIPGRLKELRVNVLGYSQKEMAKELGIGQSAYSIIEQGTRSELRMQHVVTLFEKFGINPNWLILGIGKQIMPDYEKNQYPNVKDLSGPEFDEIWKRIEKLEQQIAEEIRTKNEDPNE